MKFTVEMTEEQFNTLNMALCRAAVTSEDREADETLSAGYREAMGQDAAKINSLRDYIYTKKQIQY